MSDEHNECDKSGCTTSSSRMTEEEADRRNAQLSAEAEWAIREHDRKQNGL